MNDFMPFTKDMMFCEVMKNDDVCRDMIERIINRPLKKIIRKNRQQVITAGIDIRSIRLDVCVETADGLLIDVEMQVGRYKELPLRFRGYQSVMDSSYWKPGNHYDELKETYIIFLCLGDPFEQKLPVYTFKPVCLETDKVSADFRTHWLALNAKAFDSAPEPIKSLLEYMAKGEPTDDDLVQQINDIVINVNNDAEKVSEMMTVQNIIDENERFAKQIELEKEKNDKLTVELHGKNNEIEHQRNENISLLSKISKLEAKLSELKAKKK